MIGYMPEANSDRSLAPHPPLFTVGANSGAEVSAYPFGAHEFTPDC